MIKTYSIAEAKDQLSSVVRAAEMSGPVELTRRGRPVAVVVEHATFRRMSESRPNFWDVVLETREALEAEPIDLDPDEIFAGVEDRSPAKDVSF